MLEDCLLRFARRGTVSADAASVELKDAFIKVDAQLRHELPPDDRSGTTVVAAIITRPRPTEYCVHVVHCGDSRAVVCTGDKLICSEDHKPNRQDEMKRIIAAGGVVQHGSLGAGPMRVDGALAVSRALGDFQFKSEALDPRLCKVTALPEVCTVPGLLAGDWVLLACDGVFDVMENEEVRDFVASRIRKAGNEPADGGAILTEMLHHCLAKGSKDNCTACLVQLLTGGATSSYSRELVLGAYDRASPDVQVKYAEFFTSHGFEAEARQLMSTLNSKGGPGQASRTSYQGQNVVTRQDTTMVRPGMRASGSGATTGDEGAASPSLASEETFAVGDKVRVRDSGDDEWRIGAVTKVSPLMVLADGWQVSYIWKVVEPFPTKGQGSPKPKEKSKFAWSKVCQAMRSSRVIPSALRARSATATTGDACSRQGAELSDKNSV
jgi:serine/threonine protein phosphatase PrpC